MSPAPDDPSIESRILGGQWPSSWDVLWTHLLPLSAEFHEREAKPRYLAIANQRGILGYYPVLGIRQQHHVFTSVGAQTYSEFPGRACRIELLGSDNRTVLESAGITEDGAALLLIDAALRSDTSLAAVLIASGTRAVIEHFRQHPMTAPESHEPGG